MGNVKTGQKGKGNENFPDNSDDSIISNPNNLGNVKNDVLNVIELMGPTSPERFQSRSDLYTGTEDEPASITETVTDNGTLFSVLTIRNDADSNMAEKASNESVYSAEYIPCPRRCCSQQGCQFQGYMRQSYMPIIQESLHKINKNGKALTKKKSLRDWFRCKVMNKPFNNASNTDYYKVNVKHSLLEDCPPRRLVFDLVDEFPKPAQLNSGTQVDTRYFKNRESIPYKNNTQREKGPPYEKRASYRKTVKNYKNEKLYFKPEESDQELASMIISSNSVRVDYCGGLDNKKSHFDIGNTKVDVYYFDHGNSTYLRTTDRAPLAKCESIAEKTEQFTTRFWAEIFGTFHIGFSFCTGFILQLFRFILYSLVRPLTIGVIQLASDYFFKPFLTTLFNSVIQPPLIFLYNIATSVRDLCEPVAEAIGYFLREVAVVVRAFRIVEVKQEKNTTCPGRIPMCGKERETSV